MKKRKGKVILERNKKGQWYFKIVATNGRILCHSESYSSLDKALGGFHAVMAPAEYDVVIKGGRNE